jgi:hypothetical protein
MTDEVKLKEENGPSRSIPALVGNVHPGHTKRHKYERSAALAKVHLRSRFGEDGKRELGMGP